mmetsp:Transcript_59157/g.139403  ORF Transcript_59157/g.139403 Transcript_59157/m.139403 type:complete len:83 (+) Transcript_59157:461-709(+)
MSSKGPGVARTSWRDRLECRGGGCGGLQNTSVALCRKVAGPGIALPSLLLTRAENVELSVDFIRRSKIHRDSFKPPERRHAP